MAPDEQLIKQIQEGESETYGQLFRKYYQQVYSICFSILRNSHDAEEVTSETFIHAYLKLSQLKNPEKFFAWLKKIAENRSKNYARQRRAETISLDLASAQTAEQIPVHSSIVSLAQFAPDEHLLKQELIDAVMEVIESLPPKDREVIQARINGLSHSEISEQLSISISASMNRLYRARKKIAAHVKNLLSCIIGLPKTLPLKKIVSGGIKAMKIGTSKEVTTGIFAATQSLMFSVIFHIALFISLSFLLPYKFHLDKQKVDVYTEVSLIPTEKQQPMPRPSKGEAQLSISEDGFTGVNHVKSSFPLIKEESPSKTPRGFLSAKKPESQGEIGEAIIRMGQGMRELQIGAGVSVKDGERMLSGSGKGEEILPSASVERGLKVGRGGVGLTTDGVAQLAKGRGGMKLEITKVERLKTVSPQREKVSKQAGLSMLGDVGAADADDILANVTKDRPDLFTRAPYLEGIFINGRLAVIYCQEGYAFIMSSSTQPQPVFRLMTNIIVYALTHSGISDKSRYVPEKDIQESAEEIPKKPPFIPPPTPNLRP